MGEPLNHIHQDTKSARFIAVCERGLRKITRARPPLSVLTVHSEFPLSFVILKYSEFLVISYFKSIFPRIYVSNMWVVKDDEYFTNEEYDDLLTSSLRNQQFEPTPPQQSKNETDKSTWIDIIEGEDDYFDTENNYTDVEDGQQKERYVGVAT